VHLSRYNTYPRASPGLFAMVQRHAQVLCQCLRKFCLPLSKIGPPQNLQFPLAMFHDIGLGGLRWVRIGRPLFRGMPYLGEPSCPKRVSRV
jgi:hypothetical protein